MGERRRSGISALLGLLAGLTLFLAAGLWFVGGAERAARQDVEVRKATVASAGFAALAGALETTEPPPETVAAAVAAWKQADPSIRAVRLVRQSGAQLIFSDIDSDLAAGAVPRRLVRDEKSLFDQAARLRANAEGNAAEGVKRLPEIEVAPAGPGVLAVTTPVLVGGSYWGMAEVRRAMTPADAADRWSTALLPGALSLALFIPVLLGVARSGLAPRARRWVLFLAALLLFAAAAGFVGRAALADLAAGTQSVVAGIGQLQGDLRQAATPVLAAAGLPPLAEQVWDVDAYQRPLGQITAAGAIDPASVAAALSAHVGGVARQLWITAGLSALLLAAFALGAMGRLAHTLTEHRQAYAYVAPAIIGMLLLVFFPFAYGVALAFTDRTLFNQSVPLTELWVGLDNFVRILGDVDVLRSTPDGWIVNYESFYWTLFITICWTIINVAIGVTLGLILALALNTEGLRGRAIYRVLLILPWAIPNYITALTWKGMFHQQFGVINQAIMLFGGEPVAWFDSVFSSFMTGVITNGWLSFPFMMVVSLGALQSIPTDMYEAAELDGASKWQQFWGITLPLLKPALVPAIILSVVWTFNMFNVIYLVSGGDPAGATEILITKAYKIAFERYQYAYAAAYSLVIFVILLAYGVFQNRVSRATERVA